jgi:hypothetical protein
MRDWHELNGTYSYYHDFFHCSSSWFVNFFTLTINLSHFIWIQLPTRIWIRMRFMIVGNWMKSKNLWIIWKSGELIRENVKCESNEMRRLGEWPSGAVRFCPDQLVKSDFGDVKESIKTMINNTIEKNSINLETSPNSYIEVIFHSNHDRLANFWFQ